MPGKKCVNAEKKYTNGSEPRQEKVICSFLHVSHPICKKPRCADRLPRGQTYVIATWKKEETECQVTDVWQEDKLAQRRAGSRSACFSGYTPGRTMERRTLPWCKKRYKEHSWTFIKKRTCTQTLHGAVECMHEHTLSPPAPGGGEVPNHLVYLHLTCNHHNSAPAATTCLVHQNSVWCILSPRYQPQSAAIPSALPTMPSCLLRLHQNCPSATTKLRASLITCQPRQPVTATLNHEITCWEAEIWRDLVQNETSIMWLKARN